MIENEIIWEHEGWVLAFEDFLAVTDTYVYRLTPPKWAVRFEVARNGVPGGEHLDVQHNADRMQRALVDAILDNPVVAKEIKKRIARDEWEGYIGVREEERGRGPYESRYKEEKA